MLAGPIFSRESLTLPRQLRHYLLRSGYVALLFVLMWTASQITFEFQEVRHVGELARFGSLVFQVFAIVQLSLVLFFALLFAAGSVAQEKDRGTLLLLLLTDLRDREIVLGKLLASLLTVAVLLLASLPAFALIQLLGGVGFDQIVWAVLLCGATALAAGSWGTLVAFWREKTFQTLAVSVIGAVVFLGATFAAMGFFEEQSPVATAAAALNPYRALFDVLAPLSGHRGLEPVRVHALGSVAALLLLAGVLTAITVARLRAWNPSRSVAPRLEDAGETQAGRSRVKHRTIWSNPVIWREMRTRAYGRKVFVIKLAYVLLAAFVAFSMQREAGGALILGMFTPPGAAFIALTLLGLMLVNAQAVTSLTGERDGKTLELLLVTDITAREFIFGKLGGVMYNAKEVIAIPLLLAGLEVQQGALSVEHFVYLVIGFAVLVCFSAMLGLHAGLSFDSSRSAIANSLGTMFFLFVGIFIFMMLLVEARTSFELQFQSFVLFIIGGSIALYFSLTHKNPSTAFFVASGMLPFLTFYSITEFLLGGSLGVCFAIAWAYGFTTVAMLIPAVSDFDVALGRTTMDKG